MAKFNCIKCDGKGIIKAFSHVVGGTCFACNGTGKVEQKNAPKKSESYVFSFLWLDESRANYNNGEFCRCFVKKARSLKAAQKIAEQAMAKNGAQDFKIELAA